MASSRSKQLIGGVSLLIPSVIVFYYGSTGSSLYLFLIGFMGFITSIGLMGGLKNKISLLVTASLSLLFFTHLFVVLIPTSIQIRLLSAISLFFVFLSFYTSLD